jgi:hypothetical protein
LLVNNDNNDINDNKSNPNFNLSLKSADKILPPPQRSALDPYFSYIVTSNM